MKKLALLVVITVALLFGLAVVSIVRAQDPGAAADVVRIDPATDVVYIDWRLVALTARGKGDAASMPIMVAAAKIMLAVRDGRWKPMPK